MHKMQLTSCDTKEYISVLTSRWQQSSKWMDDWPIKKMQCKIRKSVRKEQIDEKQNVIIMFSAGQVCVIDSLCITMIRALDKHTSFASYNNGYKPNSKFTGRDCGYLVLKGYVYIHAGLLCSYCSYCCSSSSFVFPNSHWKFFRRTLMTMRTERRLLPSSGSLKIFFLDSNDYEWEIKWKNILFC